MPRSATILRRALHFGTLLLVFTIGFTQALRAQARSDQAEFAVASAASTMRLTPVTSAPESAVGSAVAVSGDRILVGAPVDSEKGPGAGAAYVYALNGGTWTLEAKLTASNGAANHDFGTSVALDGNRAIVGAPGELFDAGSAYIFDFDGTRWTESAQIYDQVGAPNLRFGHSVALDGDRAVVGVPGDSEFGVYRGSAYVFELNGAQWTETRQFKISDGGSGNPLGTSVSLDGDRALVGAGAVLPTSSFGGDYTAYVFTFDGTEWDEGVRLQASEPNNARAFGTSVSLDGDRALVGAFANHPDGAAYIYTFNGTDWEETATLGLPAESYTFGFGVSVALDGDRALIGHYNDDNGMDGNPGAAYVFEFDGSTWNLSDRIVADDGVNGDRFGHAVALDGDRAVLGAPRDNGASGSVRVLDYDGSGWVAQDPFSPADGVELYMDWFGSAASLDGDRALVGAPNDGGGLGSVYVFSSTGTSWEQQANFVSPDAERGFGSSISLDGTRALIGAPEDNGYVGGAYVYAFDGTTWVQEAELTLPEGARRFGVAVSLDGNRALVGDAENGRSGKAHIFEYDGSAWALQTTLEPSEDSDYGFGTSVALDGDRALIGSPRTKSAFIFALDGAEWSEQAILKTSNSDADDFFGASVSLDGDRALVGAPSDYAAHFFAFDGTSWVEENVFDYDYVDEGYDGFGLATALDGDRAMVGGNEGAFSFSFDGTDWVEHVALDSPAGSLGREFGKAVALSGNLALVGDPREKLNAEDLNGSGGAYVFDLSQDNVASEPNTEIARTLDLDIYPNPARDVAMINLTSPDPGEVLVEVFDVLGRRVGAPLQEGHFASGRQTLSIDTAALPAGHYFVRATTAGSTQTLRFAVVR